METLTFVFTDIEGSTALLRRVGDGVYAQVLTEHHELIRSALADHDGRELNTLGDGFFAAFGSPRECAAAVLDMQRALAAHSWPGGERVLVRIGVHTGEASQTPATGVLGLDVHRAARIAAVAHGGQILLSETAAALVRDALPAGAVLTDLGAHRLKDLGRPEQLYQLTAEFLTATFPPLASLDNPDLPNNLPVQPAKFVGRGRELGEVRKLIEGARLVTLTGAGGSGKTRLALQAAAEVLDGSGDGVWLVELAAVTDEEAVPSAAAAALGIPVQGRPAADALLSALVPQNALLVLDNCEHLIGACAKLADAILRRCPRVYLLATSREPLGIGGEVIYRVPSLSLPDSPLADPSLPGLSLPGLSLPDAPPAELSLPEADDADLVTAHSSDAVALFTDRAAEQGVTVPVDRHTAPLLVSICRRLDGMPLAIELAAARLRSLSLSELHDRLDQRFRLLTGGSRAALPRQQTLLAAVDWSYSLLSQWEKLLLRRLSAFADGFDLPAAEAVCGYGQIDPFDVAALLGSLVDKSLVQAEPAGDTLRYRLLETIRQFAAELPVDDAAGRGDAEAVRAAHCEYFLAFAESAAEHLTSADQGSWLRRLATDDANLRRAVQYAIAAPGATARVLRFLVALHRYWMSPRHEHEAFVLMQPVLMRPDARADLALFGRALVTAAALGRAMRVGTVREYCEEAADLGRQLGDDRMVAAALGLLSSTFYFNGEPERGLPYGEESIGLARHLGDDVVLAVCLTQYLLCLDAVEPGHSGALFDEAIACTQRSGDLHFVCVLQNNAGVRALRVRDLQSARAHLQAAAEGEAALGSSGHHLRVNLGWVHRLEGDFGGARASFESALRLSRRTGDEAGVAYSVLGLACIAADLGEWQRACQLHGAAQAELQRSGWVWQVDEEEFRQASLDAVRDALGVQEFNRAYARGLALTFDEAFRLAVGDLASAAADVPA